MNASIQGIIDHMFKDTVVNAETRALHEELLNNCLEHYDDLIGRGMSETEAIDAVVDSLKGMKEVIDEYPKKSVAAGNPEPRADMQKTKEQKQQVPMIETEKKEEEIPPQEKPSEYSFDPDTVKKLRTDLKNCDLKIGISDDKLIHVRCEDMEQLECEQNGDVLTVRITDKTRKSLEEAGKQISGSDFSLKGLLSFIGKAIGSAASSITVSWNVYIDLPETVIREMDLNAKSGDVEMNAYLPERLTVRTMSGDVNVEARGTYCAEKVTISAMSGEIEFTGNAGQIVCSSMSGDVKARGAFTETDLKSTSGDVNLDGTAERVRLHSVSGDVTAEVRNTDVRFIETRSTSGDAEIRLAPGTDSIHAETSTVSGSVHCSSADCGSGAHLQIRASSVSGDVTIR